MGSKATHGQRHEANVFHTQEADVHEQSLDETIYTTDDWNEDEWIESLANEGDEDAAMIMDYESTMLDAVQENEDLALTQSTYMDARRRLSERFKNRGFWPPSQNKGKGKGKGGDKGKRPSYPSMRAIAKASSKVSWRAAAESVVVKATGRPSALNVDHSPHHRQQLLPHW